MTDKTDTLMQLLARARPYIIEAHNSAEAKHDDSTDPEYMDYGQYEIMQETDRLLKEIDSILFTVEER